MNRVEQLNSQPTNYNLRPFWSVKNAQGAEFLGLNRFEPREVNMAFPGNPAVYVNSETKITAPEGVAFDPNQVVALAPDQFRIRLHLKALGFRENATPLTVVFHDEEDE